MCIVVYMYCIYIAAPLLRPQASGFLRNSRRRNLPAMTSTLSVTWNSGSRGRQPSRGRPIADGTAATKKGINLRLRILGTSISLEQPLAQLPPATPSICKP